MRTLKGVIAHGLFVFPKAEGALTNQRNFAQAHGQQTAFGLVEFGLCRWRIAPEGHCFRRHNAGPRQNSQGLLFSARQDIAVFAA